MIIRKYHHLISRVEYPQERGYRMEISPLPDWIYVCIVKDGDSKYMTVHSRIHVNKEVRINPDYSLAFSDQEIIKDLSGEVAHMFFN
jgi:hypothetical protein